ncbi:penicillin-binding protein 1C [Hydrogenophaga laconesensis]|uniref:peptidoglycan glycosyltransferase n=1 Tax=Hydrogenophaga laconesensis TaxID=1805971 RepID=A0ABU1VC45_9BURK|nr:penicillin-binding protein 1C [Hydrogenophaga laconesensis]MDR7095046.1 penicillin-binding protein 1C [Hydrogenophaga laconesensis]
MNLRHALAAIALGLGLAPHAQALPSFAEVQADWRPSDARVLDRHGELLQRVRVDHRVRRGEWIALADMSPALRTAMVLSEDKRFHEHSGVDWRAVSAAAWGNLWNTRTRGASTITMQLAALLDEPDGDLQRGAGGRRVSQKIGQAVAAQSLERRWRKDQILEAYLNLVPFRGEIVGIDALSRTLFGKAAHGLDESEAALAAALVRGPNAAPRQVAQRACGVLRLMQTGTTVDCVVLQAFADMALNSREFPATEGIAPHHARRVLSEQTPGTERTARSSLSAPLQRFALHTLQRHLRELRGRNAQDGALVVLDNASGDVMAWVGSSGELSAASEVDGVTALRQPGSTLKPFLYAQAIAQRRMTAASLLEDSPAAIPTTSGLYIPQNYDRQFKGWVSARTALASSLNVPAVRTLVMVSPDAFHRQLGAMGLPLRESAGYYGYSLALGSAEVPLLSLTNAFRTLANGGRHGPVGSPPQGEAVIDPRAAFIVGDILSDPNARARTFGTDSLLATRFWTAVKTGTSKDMRDNWAVGWSERYTVGVWVGNASGAPMWNVSGTSGAAPIWADVMQHLHARTPSRPPTPPVGLVQVRTRFDGADGRRPLEATRSEWFIAGTEQASFAMDTPDAAVQPTGAPLRIRSPAPGTIVALDPDIPPNRQRLTFIASGTGGRWRLDGKPLAQGAQVQWLPWPGRHVMQLTDARGKVLDEVRFEVRGAGVKAHAGNH